MPVSAAERRYILDNLTRLAEADIQTLWRVAELQSDIDFAAYVTQAFPDLVDPYHQIAAQTSAAFFENDFPDITTPAIMAASLPAGKLTNSAKWALGADGTDAISRMVGTAQRAIYDGDRNTTAGNAKRNGMDWVRVARPGACAYCRLEASRTAFGEKSTARHYHDHCHCTGAAIPVGVDPMDHLAVTEPQFADLAAQWDSEARKAQNAAGTADTKAILAEWRQLDPTAR